ncbi:Aspartic peptidase [Trema orientale]|uniref:Aspartic peptidase n=1 Tax=Trema orientale TaxID=63057 RepID=A0A2P5FWV2_TREOI|nr:Aspartic peptidase [Trema orientale]
MASAKTACSHIWFLLFSVSIFYLVSTNNTAQATLQKVKPYVPPFISMYLPIQKDNVTLQYYTTVQWGSIGNYFDAVIDLGGEFLSLPCDSKDKSTTYRPINCGSSNCRGAKKISNQYCRSPNDTCSVSYLNPFDDNSVLTGGLNKDGFVAIPSDGDRLYREWQRTPHLLPFSCVNRSSLKGLARGFIETVAGTPTAMIGLGATKMSFAKNLATAFKLAPKFAICLPATEVGKAVLFLGGGPYWFNPPKEASKWLDYTPLTINPSGEYFIGVKSMKIDKRVVNFDISLLSFNGETGVGGTKISTSTPYAVLHSAIYKAVVDEFARQAAARNITRVASVAPFGACFSSKSVAWTKAGPGVPVIDLELEGNGTSSTSVKWRIHGANSMLEAKKDVLCLGFVDGGSKPIASIVIGGLQLEDNLLEFDLKTLTLGFTSSLLPRDTNCSVDRYDFPDD